MVQRPVGAILRNAETVSHVGVQRIIPPLAAKRAPAANDRIPVPVVLCVKHPRDADLMLIAGAERAPGFLLGPRERRQKQGCQISDDGDHDQQLDQSESAVQMAVAAFAFAGCKLAKNFSRANHSNHSVLGSAGHTAGPAP